jgi:hypothetical protein
MGSPLSLVLSSVVGSSANNRSWTIRNLVAACSVAIDDAAAVVVVVAAAAAGLLLLLHKHLDPTDSESSLGRLAVMASLDPWYRSVSLMYGKQSVCYIQI